MTMAQISKSPSARNGTNKLIRNSRIAMINFGKVLPFLICAIVALSYAECFKAMWFCDYLQFSDGIYLNKPISFAIASCFELDLPTLAFLAIISIAVRTCIWNKLAIVYLSANLYEKSYFATHQWDNENGYYIVIALNIIICLFLVFKGIRNSL